MSRQKKIYSNGQSRGGIPGKAVDSGCRLGRNKKNYHAMETSFHGGELAYEKWVKNGRKGYS